MGRIIGEECEMAANRSPGLQITDEGVYFEPVGSHKTDPFREDPQPPPEEPRGGYLLPKQLKKRVIKKDLGSRLLWGLGIVLQRIGGKIGVLGIHISHGALTEVVVIDDFPGWFADYMGRHMPEAQARDRAAAANDVATD